MFACVCAVKFRRLSLILGPYLRGIRDQPPKYSHLKKISALFHHISAFVVVNTVSEYHKLKQRSIAFSLHLLKAFCETQKLLIRPLRPGCRPGPGWGRSRPPPELLVGWVWGERHPSQIPTPSTPSASRFCRLRCLIPVIPSETFICIRLWFIPIGPSRR